MTHLKPGARAWVVTLGLLVIASAAIPTRPLRAQTVTPPLPRTYNFGERTLEQTWLPRRDPNRTMPYRADGIVAVPEGDGPFPLVLIFHGAQGGCPLDTTNPDLPTEKWPCKPEEEQRNDVGITYLASALASRGYLAVVPNLNAVYATAFGSAGAEPRRYPEVLAAHLNGLVEANSTDSDAFDVSLQGKVDFTRIGIVGYGYGALLAMQSARARQSRSLDELDSPADGPLSGVLLLAPFYTPEGDADVPLSVVLPSCDGVTPDLSGQSFYEDARLNRDRTSWAASVYLIGANHNAWNEVVKTDDAEQLSSRSGCSSAERRNVRLAPQTQRDFLMQYAPDFLDAAMQRTPASAQAGLDPTAPAPNSLYGAPVLTALSLGASQRGIVLQPRARDDLGYNEFGGYSTNDGPSDLEYCAYRQPCTRWAIQPGNPSQVRFSWNDPVNAKWIIPLGEPAADLSQFATLHMRLALDPTDYLNAHRKRQIIRLTLTDVNDQTSVVPMSEETTAALAYPRGEPDVRAWGWAGHAYLSSVRVPLSAFTGVDLTRIKSLDISAGNAPSGSLLVSDIEFLRPTPQ